MRRVALAAAIMFLAVLWPSPGHAQGSQGRTCRITAVNVFADRVELFCEYPGKDKAAGAPQSDYDSVRQFATEIGNPLADKAVTIGLQAMTLGRAISVNYSGDGAQNPKNCLVACRRLTGLFYR